MKYDKEFIIFGNAELRVWPEKKRVYSNFGIANSFFDHGADKVDALLNEGEIRET